MPHTHIHMQRMKEREREKDTQKRDHTCSKFIALQSEEHFR